MTLIILLSMIVFLIFVLGTYLYADSIGDLTYRAIKFLLEEKDDEK